MQTIHTGTGTSQLWWLEPSQSLDFDTKILHLINILQQCLLISNNAVLRIQSLPPWVWNSVKSSYLTAVVAVVKSTLDFNSLHPQSKIIRTMAGTDPSWIRFPYKLKLMLTRWRPVCCWGDPLQFLSHCRPQAGLLLMYPCEHSSPPSHQLL
jgi:hypothetical protein